MISVTAYPRVHVTLIDLTGTTSRRYGGIGFFLSNPATVVSFSPIGALRVECLADLDDKGVADVESAAQRCFEFMGLPARGTISVRSAPPQHSGFGSKTSIILSSIECLLRAHDKVVPDDKKIELSRRGGASGVGVHGFFDGGMIVDLGQPNDDQSPPQPSGAIVPVAPSLLLCRIPVPSQWRIHLYVPSGRRFCQSEESEVFLRGRERVQNIDTLRVLSEVYHGVVPAVIGHSLSDLRRALGAIHGLGFKSVELDAQTDAVRKFYSDAAFHPRCAVGMSSMGPLIYLIRHCDDSEAETFAEGLVGGHDVQYLGVVHPCNVGRKIERV